VNQKTTLANALREGMAWAFTKFNVDYVDQQEEARVADRGVHKHNCQPAWEWRAQHRATNGR
jgi:endonuclease YncB( thermonuclease family)